MTVCLRMHVASCSVMKALASTARITSCGTRRCTRVSLANTSIGTRATSTRHLTERGPVHDARRERSVDLRGAFASDRGDLDGRPVRQRRDHRHDRVDRKIDGAHRRVVAVHLSCRSRATTSATMAIRSRPVSGISRRATGSRRDRVHRRRPIWRRFIRAFRRAHASRYLIGRLAGTYRAAASHIRLATLSFSTREGQRGRIASPSYARLSSPEGQVGGHRFANGNWPTGMVLV